MRGKVFYLFIVSALTIGCTDRFSASTMFTSLSSSSQAYFVSPNGSDSNDGLSPLTPFQTLQKAADVVTPGYTVYVMNGTYQNADYNGSTPSQPVVTITTAGTALAPITFTNYPGHSPKLEFNGYDGFQILYPAAYLVISGFEIQGNSQNVSQNYAQTATHIDPKTNENGVAIDGNTTGSINIVHHITVENMVVHDCPLGGIDTQVTDYIIIKNNVLYRNAYWSGWAGSGISIAAAYDIDSNTTTYKNIVEGNISYANMEYIPNFNAGNVITDGNGIIIDSNNHQGTSDAPYAGKTLVANNVVYNNGGTGIHSFQSANVDLINNTAYFNNQNTNAGQIVCEYSTNCNILNNIMVAPSGVPVNSTMGNTNVIYDYNIYFGGTGAQIVGAHDVTADPLFINATSANFLIQPTSPAYSSGTSNLAPSTDILGHVRSNGNIDRGAYQH